MWQRRDPLPGQPHRLLIPALLLPAPRARRRCHVLALAHPGSRSDGVTEVHDVFAARRARCTQHPKTVRPDEVMWLARCRVESIAKRLSRCGGLAIFLFRRASSTLAQAYRANEDRTGAQSPFPTFVL
jgi:hypothetical protein